MNDILEIELPYGLKDENLVSIDDVESGLACECFCPACKNQLIAKKGNIKVHHFAHYKIKDCKSGLETAIHLLSKEIIADHKTFKTPILYYPNTNYEIFPEMEIPIDKVTLEKKLGEIIPDIIIESKGKVLIIEIVVSNPISSDKMKKIVDENIATIEIYAKYLFEYANENIDFNLNTNNSFINELIYGTKYKQWAYNPKISKIKSKLKNNYATEKLVKTFISEKKGSYKYVEHCPLEKKHWRNGRNAGKPYASIEYDCSKCDFCFAIDFDEISNSSLGFYSVPKKVYCLGHLERELRELLKQMN
jgi:hypothetical protein